MTHIPDSEVLRYLGAAKTEDETLKQSVRDICTMMEQRITPRALWKEYPCQVDEHTVSFGSVAFDGDDLARHLKSCTAVLLFAATLGPEGDRLARVESLRSMARGAMVHAAGAAMIEQFCDDTQEKIGAEYEAKGLFLRPRYSPGYGDLPLSRQVDFFHLLEAEKRLGISLSEDYTMMPSKSVTAIIGISSEKGKSFRRCLTCKKLDCPFRREG